MEIIRLNEVELKPRLVPVEVPWQISPSTPFLRLISSEVVENGATQVQFVAHFGLEDSQGDASELHRSVVVVADPGDLHDQSQSPIQSPYRRVRILFERGLWSRMCPAYSDSEVVKESKYDWSAVVGRYKSGEDPPTWLRRFKVTWLDTSICPDPGMYEVENSPWLREIESVEGSKEELRHYLFLGHDAYVEVLAEGWTWKAERDLAGW